MISISLFPYDIPFKHPFSISRNSKTSQPTLIIRMESEGRYGLGESTANAYYHMTTELLQKDLVKVKPLLAELRFTHPEKLWNQLAIPLKHNYFALCGLDLAAWDLYAKKLGKPLYKVWGLHLENRPMTDYTIGIDSIATMVRKMKEFPWPIYKIKLGTAEDVKIIKALRKENTKAIFRVDANCAWTAEETIANSHELKKLGVEFIEQPMPDPKDDKTAWEIQREVFKKSALPLIADESCIREEDVQKCYGHFHGINIKLVKCGGLTPALRMIKEARARNMKLMIGSMNESTVGSSAAAHLLPYLDYADMDGPLLHAKTIATGITFDQGKINIPEKPGTGAELIEQ